MLHQDDDYPRLRSWLLSMSAGQTLRSQWAIWTVCPASQIKAMLRMRIYEDDRVMIVEVGLDFASRRAMLDLRTKLKPEPITRRVHRYDGRG